MIKKRISHFSVPLTVSLHDENDLLTSSSSSSSSDTENEWEPDPSWVVDKNEEEQIKKWKEERNAKISSKPNLKTTSTKKKKVTKPITTPNKNTKRQHKQTFKKKKSQTTYKVCVTNTGYHSFLEQSSSYEKEPQILVLPILRPRALSLDTGEQMNDLIETAIDGESPRARTDKVNDNSSDEEDDTSEDEHTVKSSKSKPRKREKELQPDPSGTLTEPPFQTAEDLLKKYYPQSADEPRGESTEYLNTIIKDKQYSKQKKKYIKKSKRPANPFQTASEPVNLPTVPNTLSQSTGFPNRRGVERSMSHLELLGLVKGSKRGDLKELLGFAETKKKEGSLSSTMTSIPLTARTERETRNDEELSGTHSGVRVSNRMFRTFSNKRLSINRITKHNIHTDKK